MIFIVAFVFFITSLQVANSHEWYLPSCCSDQDCAAIPRSAVEEKVDGYQITLERGQHPMITREGEWFVPHDGVHPKRSEDGSFHACIHPESKRMICLHKPFEGS